jgi:hypothetical protein
MHSVRIFLTNWNRKITIEFEIIIVRVLDLASDPAALHAAVVLVGCEARLARMYREANVYVSCARRSLVL